MLHQEYGKIIEKIFEQIACTNLTNKPTGVTPPFVPLGTRFRVVIRNGSDFPTTAPISLAQVSPLQQANADITAIPNQLDRYWVVKSIGRSLLPQSSKYKSANCIAIPPLHKTWTQFRFPSPVDKLYMITHTNLCK